MSNAHEQFDWGYTVRWMAAYNKAAMRLYGSVVVTPAQDRKLSKLATQAMKDES